MKTTELQDAIISNFIKLRPYFITNYSGLTGFEQDVVMIANSGTVYEYEIKTSLSDFKNDLKKTLKHEELKNPLKNKRWVESRNYPRSPNYFYYVCKSGLIKPEDVPPYAGLIWVEKGVDIFYLKVVKKGVYLHSYKITDKLLKNICRTLSGRFYYGCSYLRYKSKK